MSSDMSSEWSGDRTSAPQPWVGKSLKRSAPDDFALEHAKRRHNIPVPVPVPVPSLQKGSDGRGITHPDRLRSRFSPPASTNAVRRFSFNDSFRQKEFSPLTRSGTGLASSVVDTPSRSDDCMFTNALHTSQLLQLILRSSSQHPWPSI